MVRGYAKRRELDPQRDKPFMRPNNLGVRAAIDCSTDLVAPIALAGC
jgi:hypothetical protein